ncbi:MAG: hypothetical protein JRH11_05225 [Deltaproteobacteria bacterium]|nr:hypothetical protein [Deltaproteobacteria bacterium]
MGAPLLGALLLLTAGCSTAVDSVDGASEGLSLVRKADLADQLMYINLAISPGPMTAAEAGDLEEAIPVVMRFYEDWAVAWYAPDGEALTRNPDDAIRMWQVLGNTDDVHVLSDDVSSSEGSTTTEPEERPSNPNLEMAPIQIDSTPNFPLPGDQAANRAFAIIDWVEDAYLEWQLIAPGFHPGCA